jgi:hypothetical protein
MPDDHPSKSSSYSGKGISESPPALDAEIMCNKSPGSNHPFALSSASDLGILAIAAFQLAREVQNIVTRTMRIEVTLMMVGATRVAAAAPGSTS